MNFNDYKREIEKNGGLPEDHYILGIDLGTTNSVISFWDSTTKRPEPIDISNGFGKIPMPSVVQFRADDDEKAGEWVIGEEAFRSMKIYPETTIRSIKRKMGTNETIAIGGKNYLPEDIAAKILVELVDHCKSLNPKAEIAGIVVSVPYDFDDAAKKATMRACEIAGIKDSLICLIEEPKAAALAYNFRRPLQLLEKILVFDFGGGTLDITLFHVGERDENHIKLQVVSEGGEAQHGGDSIDEMLLEHCFSLIEEKVGSKKGEIALENQVELSLRARETKERLSGVKMFRVPFTFCIPPFVEQITREAFEQLIMTFTEKTRRLVQKTLREAYSGAVLPEQVDRILLEGGSSQMPWVKDMLVDIFNDESKIYTSERPALDISIGATYYAAMKMGILSSPDLETEKLDVEFEVTVPHDIGFEIVSNGKKAFFTMIKRGTPYALAKKSQIFTLSGETDAEMTTFDLKILERMDKDHKIESCKPVGDVHIKGLPARPSGKTKLKISLIADEEGGMIRGIVEDYGFSDEYPKTDFKANFEPSRHIKTEISSGN